MDGGIPQDNYTWKCVEVKQNHNLSNSNIICWVFAKNQSHGVWPWLIIIINGLAPIRISSVSSVSLGFLASLAACLPMQQFPFLLLFRLLQPVVED